MKNYIWGNSPMGLGVYSPLENFPFWYLWNEMTWFVIACILIAMFTLFVKALEHLTPHIKTTIFRNTVDIQIAHQRAYDHKHLPEYIRKTFLLEKYGIHMNTSIDELKVINGNIVLNPAALWAGG